MKKIYTPALIAIVLLYSCQKSDAYLSEDDTNNYYAKGARLEQKPLAEISQCSIIRISYSLGTITDQLQFTYNSSGDPLSITRSIGAQTGRPNYLFKYDAKNRMTDFIGPYNNGSAEFWHKYFYDSKGNIVLDSGYIFPRITNGVPENAYSRQATFYTYDNKQRIISDSTVYAALIPPVVNHYAYNADGNKTGSNYDDQFNINRTNKVWMFLNRDYSVNNPYTAISYSSNGLPTNIDVHEEGQVLNFLQNSFSKAEISYQCNNKSK